MYAIRTIFMSSVAFLIMLCTGCGDSGWTDFEFVNLSKEGIRVEVLGLPGEASPGNMAASDHDGTRATSSLSGSITIDETITILWTTDGASVKNEVKLKRDDLGIPDRVRGGRITFTYSADRKWTVKYSR